MRPDSEGVCADTRQTPLQGGRPGFLVPPVGGLWGTENPAQKPLIGPEMIAKVPLTVLSLKYVYAGDSMPIGADWVVRSLWASCRKGRRT